MKQAIAYIRISTKDQSNFSLQGQEQYIRDFAAKNGYAILNVFKDDGQSAKNFDRPDWKLLQKFCKENHQQVDALIVAKYDRFSRNLKDALNMIEMLEEKYKITILSALEPIMMETSSPYFFQFRTQMLMGAQVEWLIIRQRTRQGIRTGLKAGRYFTGAPFGYINMRDAQNKPIIVIDEARAPVIRRMYEMQLQAAPLKEIYLEAKRNGYGPRGIAAVKYALMNPVYAGLIRVPADEQEPEQLVKGIHTAIIDEATWWKVQSMLTTKTINRTVMNEEVPLRSVLKCPTGSPLTAGNSKGKRRYFWYYKCKCHPRINLSAIRLHEQMNMLLSALSLPDHYINYLQEAIEKNILAQHKDRDIMITEKKRELAQLQQRLDSVEEKYINNDLDKEAYKKWTQRYQSEMAVIKKYISDYQQPVADQLAMIRTQLPKLGNLAWQYQQADLHTKQALLRTVFNSQLYYADGIYRTPYILPGFSRQATTLQEKRLLIIEQPIHKPAEMQGCAPDRS